MRVIALILAFLLSFPLDAAPLAILRGNVVRVKDGDSIVVRRAPTNRNVEIRLAGIDAPEHGQPWGTEAARALRGMVDGREVRVDVYDRDRYNRLVGKVFLDRIYVNAALVRDGHAWAFDRYIADDAIRLAQKSARAQRRGLWSLPPSQRLPPATWRKQHPRRD